MAAYGAGGLGARAVVAKEEPRAGRLTRTVGSGGLPIVRVPTARTDQALQDKSMRFKLPLLAAPATNSILASTPPIELEWFSDLGPRPARSTAPRLERAQLIQLVGVGVGRLDDKPAGGWLAQLGRSGQLGLSREPTSGSQPNQLSTANVRDEPPAGNQPPSFSGSTPPFNLPGRVQPALAGSSPGACAGPSTVPLAACIHSGTDSSLKPCLRHPSIPASRVIVQLSLPCAADGRGRRARPDGVD